ncbi:MAG: methyltransferase domain-containing protein, partial [Gammaproteobacteria bacterium]
GEQRSKRPLIETNSVDLVISNCVLNLVSDKEKQQLVNEIFRVLKPGGRMAISDIVCDEPVPCRLKADKELWSGCISGAFQEQEIMKMFVEAGFQALCFDMWSTEPWRVIENIEFRAVTLTGVKPEDKGRFDYGHAVIYRGPFNAVYDDDGNAFPRGECMAVCERTFRFLTEGPYQDDFIGITPAVERDPVPWCAPSGTKRPVAETKGGVQINSDVSGSCCY